MTVYIDLKLQQKERKIIEKAASPTDKFWYAQDIPEDQRFNTFLEAEVVFGSVPPGWVEESQHLRWLQLPSAGVDPYLKLDWGNRLSKVEVTNLGNFYGTPVAETALGGILSLYRHLDKLSQLQMQQKWVGAAIRPEMNLLHEKKVLILGGGAIGKTLKKLLEAFSCPVTMIRRSSSPNLNNIDDLLPDADIVINCLPETSETKEVLHARRLKLMKEDAIFVNVGRGSVINEKDLIEALQQSKLGGAILDVTQIEPTPQDNPLWSCPNVILTQHTGGGYIAENTDKAKAFAENFSRYSIGKALLHVVDFKKGY